MLLAVILMVTMISVALAAGALRMKQQIQRDREDELVHRAKEYVHAVRLYYRKFGHYPANLDQLDNTNNLRFLRKRYTDPITGKDDWHLIHFGEATNTNQPINGASPAGTNTNTSTTTNTNTTQGAPGQPGQTGLPNAVPNQTFGGAGIIGVSSASELEGIKEFKKKKHYNEWQFFYDPSQEFMGGGQVQTNAPNNTGLPNNTGFPNQQPTNNNNPAPNPTQQQ